MLRRLLIIPAVAALIASVAAAVLVTNVRRNPAAPKPAEASSVVPVNIQVYEFNPSFVTITTGDTIHWIGNNFGGGDIHDHTTTSDSGVTPPWDHYLPPGNPNNTYDVTFNAPGVYTYHCSIHPVMTGTIVVEDPVTPSPTPTATSTATATPTATPTPIPNFTPVISGNVSPIGGPDPLLTNFNWTATDADNDTLSATITWGDASSDNATVPPPYAPQSNPHTYNAPGSYQAKVSIDDGHGHVASVSRTVLVGPDADGDQIPDAFDNCTSMPNANQANADHEIDNGPGIAAPDVTVPRAVDDAVGDACSPGPDTDRDGLPDAEDAEPLTGSGLCGGLTSSDGHPNPAGGDITNDDNGNGIPAPADAADNGPSWDTDDDGVLDGVECQFGTDPRSAASKPGASMCGGGIDADMDGLPASAETCKWGTSDTNADTDGDGKKDCVEANDTNGDGVQNFPGDTVNSAKAANGVIGKTMDFDLNGDGVVNFPGDTILSAKMANHVGGIC